MSRIPYSGYSSPQGSTIADLILRRGEIGARSAENIGNIRARAAEQKGQAWGQAAQTIGDIARGVPMQIAQQREQAAIDAQRRSVTEANNLKTEQDREELEAQKRNRALFESAITTSKTPDGTTDWNAVVGKVRQSNPRMAAQLVTDIEKVSTWTKSITEADIADRQKLLDKEIELVLSADSPEQLLRMAGALVTDQIVDPGIGEAIKRDVSGLTPEQWTAFQDEKLALSSPAFRDRWLKDRKTAADIAHTEADTYKIRNPEPKPVQSEDFMLDGQRVKGMFDPIARKYLYNGQDVTARVQAIPPASMSGMGGGDGGLTPDAVDYTATQYRILGPSGIPTRIEARDREKILNAAAQQAKMLGQSPAVAVQKQSAYKADAAALNRMRVMSSAAAAFENKAIEQAGIVADLSAKVPRTQFPILNKALLEGKKDILGDTNTQLLYNAITTFTSEYSKIIEGSTGSVAASTDSARKAAAELVFPALAKGTLAKTLDLMKREMRLTIDGYDTVIGHITDRMIGPGATPSSGGTPPPAGAMIEARDPQGNIHHAPAGTPLPRGWSLVTR